MSGTTSEQVGRYGPGVKKPAGGFQLVSEGALIGAWWAYRAHYIRLYDLRVWFACLEAMARRCCMAAGRRPRFDFQEIHRLVGGVDPGQVGPAVRRLRAVGLLDWSSERVQVDGGAGHLPEEVLLKASAAGADRCSRRRVPVPRRVARQLARYGGRAVIGTALGHLLRCSYYRAGLCFARGTCKASWIATAFGLDVRSVKRARAYWVELGWLFTERRPQRTLNRHGASVVLNLDWMRRGTERDPNELPPPVAAGEGCLSPPIRNKKLLRMKQEPEPASRGRSGAQRGDGEEIPASRKGSSRRTRCPALGHVVPADLDDAQRLTRLFEQAVKVRLIGRCEGERLNFFAAARHARSVGLWNPCGLFVATVRQRRWTFITQRDEDEARHVLRRLGPLKNECTSTQALDAEAPRQNVREDRAAIRSTIVRSLGRPSGVRRLSECQNSVSKSDVGWARAPGKAGVRDFETPFERERFVAHWGGARNARSGTMGENEPSGECGYEPLEELTSDNAPGRLCGRGAARGVGNATPSTERDGAAKRGPCDRTCYVAASEPAQRPRPCRHHVRAVGDVGPAACTPSTGFDTHNHARTGARASRLAAGAKPPGAVGCRRIPAYSGAAGDGVTVSRADFKGGGSAVRHSHLGFAVGKSDGSIATDYCLFSPLHW